VDELLLLRVVAQVALQPHTDVGGVDRAHRAVHHLGVGHRRLARLDAVEEVADVAHPVTRVFRVETIPGHDRPARPLGVGADQLLGVGQQRLRGDLRRLVAVGDGHPALAALVADAARAAPALALEDHLDAVGEGGDHAVARAVVDVSVADRRGVHQAESHLALGEGVRAPLPDAAGVEVVVAAPAALDVGGVVRPLRAGAQPQVPVHQLLVGLGLPGQVVAAHVGVVPGGDVRPHRAHLAEPARPQQLVGDREVGLAQTLRPGLVDAFVLLGGGHPRLPLRNGHARGLLGVDVLAGLHGQDRGEGVPPVAGGDQDGVDALVLFQHLAEVAEGGAVLAAVVLVRHPLDRLAARLLHVADGHKLHFLLPQHPLEHEGAAGADADAGEVDARVGRGLAAERQGAGGDEQRGAEHGAGGRGPLEELTAGRGRRVERLVGHGTFLSSLGWLGTGRKFAGSVLINYNSPIEWHPDSAGSSPEDPSNVRKGRAMLKHLVLALLLVVVGLRGAAAVDDWRSLITDDELNDWQGSGGGDIFRARSGTLTVDGAGQIVFASDTKPVDLRDFELRAEGLTRPGGRAGLALHLPSANPRSPGGAEVRLDNSYSRGTGQGLLKTGSLVWLRPVVKSAVPDGRWFSLHVTVRGRRVQVRVEKQLVMDYVQPEN